MKQYSLYTLFILLQAYRSTAQLACPPNIDFESGTLSHWSCFTGINSGTTSYRWAPSSPVGNRHMITSGAATDFYGGFPVVPPVSGGLYALKLGNALTGGEAEKVSYTFTVPATLNNYSLIYRYAVVFQNPPHAPHEQPFFEVSAYDSATGNLLSCASSKFVANSGLPGFIETAPGSEIWYKEWTTSALRLTGLAGRTITVEFATADCSLGAHFGYGYVDLSCGLFAITNANCNGSLTTPLAAPPGFQNYTWYNDDYSIVIGNLRNITIPTPAATTIFHVVLTPYPGYGCVDTLTTSVAFSNLNVRATPDSANLCNIPGIKLNTTQTGSAPPYTYSWTPTAGLSCVTCPDPMASPGVNTRYVVAVTDAIGCTIYDSVFITAGVSVTESHTDATCANATNGTATATASNGVPPYTYRWNTVPVQRTATATKLKPGTYSVTVTDAAGCVFTKNVTIGISPIPAIISKSDISCYGGHDGIASVSTGGTSTFYYLWNTVPPRTTDTITNLSVGSYSVTVSDDFGCSVIKTITIFQPSPISARVTVNNPRCATDSNASIDLTVTGGSGTYSYLWQTAPVQTTSSAVSLHAGTYTCFITDTKGCRDSVKGTVTAPPPVLLRTSILQQSCNGLKNSIVEAVASGGTGALRYEWNITPVRTTPVVDHIGAGTYIVRVFDAMGCSSSDTVRVTDYPISPVTATGGQEICKGETVTLGVTGAQTYIWSPAAGLSCSNCSSPVTSPDTTVTYTVTGTDGNGCSDTDRLVIRVIQPVPTSVDSSRTICLGDQIMLKASGGQGYAWTPAATLRGSFLPNPVAFPAQTTTYQVIITENRCFTDTLYQTITVLPLPAIDIIDGFSGIPGAKVQLHTTVANAVSIAWRPPQGLDCYDCYEPTATLDKTIVYVAEVTDRNGCKAIDTIRIIVGCDPSAFYMANTFTPNNDGRNDFFYPQAMGINMVSRFMIYSRWGEVVFSASNMPLNVPERGWDGTFKGKELPPDVFVYAIEAICADGTPIVLKGDVTLVR